MHAPWFTPLSVMTDNALSYRINGNEVITAIEGCWDAFARTNGAPELLQQRVIGTELMQHISGSGTRQLYRELIALVRRESGREFRFPFRCDSPELRRYLQMTVHSPDGQTVVFSSHLLREEPRAYQGLLDRQTQYSGSLVVMCSWCKRVRISETHWVELEEGIEQLGLMNGGPYPRISHGICPSCYLDVLGKGAE